MGLFDWIKKSEFPIGEKNFALEDAKTIALLEKDMETQKPYLVLRSDGSKSRGRITAVRNPLVDLTFTDEKDGIEKHKVVGIRDFLSWQ